MHSKNNDVPSLTTLVLVLALFVAALVVVAIEWNIREQLNKTRKAWFYEHVAVLAIIETTVECKWERREREGVVVQREEGIEACRRIYKLAARMSEGFVD